MLESKTESTSPDTGHLAVTSSLAETMGVEVILGRDGRVSILHNQKLPFILNWVEGDPQGKMEPLVLVTQDGTMCPVGLELPTAIRKRLAEIEEIAVILMEDQKPKDIYLLPYMKTDF